RPRRVRVRRRVDRPRTAVPRAVRARHPVRPAVPGRLQRPVLAVRDRPQFRYLRLREAYRPPPGRTQGLEIALVTRYSRPLPRSVGDTPWHCKNVDAAQPSLVISAPRGAGSPARTGRPFRRARTAARRAFRTASA